MGKFSDKLVKGSIFSFGSIVSINIINFVYTLFLIRLLLHVEGPTRGYEVLGIFSFLRELGQIVIPLLILGLHTAMAKYIPDYEASKRNKLNLLINTSFSIAVISGILGCIVYFISSDMIAFIVDEPLIGTLMKINVIYVAGSVMITVIMGMIQGFQRIKLLAKLNVVNAAISLPVLIVFGLMFSIEGVVLAAGINVIIVLVIVLYSLRDILRSKEMKLKFERSKEITAELFKFTAPLIMSIIILRPAHLFGRAYLGYFTDWGVEVGYYKIAFTFYGLLLFIPSAISIPLLPMISELDATRPDVRAALISRIIKMGMFIVLPFSIILGLLAPAFIWVLTGDPALPADEIVFLMAMTAYMMIFFALAGNALIGTGKTMQLLYIDIVHSILFVILVYFLINRYELAGLGWAWLIIPIVLIVPYIIYLYKNDYIQLRPIGQALGVTAVFVPLTFFTYYFLTDYILIMLYLIIIPLVMIEYALLSDKDKKLIEEWYTKIVGRLRGKH